jgi:enoyl-CoA hydratase/carnithine racemase
VTQALEAVSVTMAGPVARMEIGRGDRHNCMDMDGWRLLAVTARQLAADDSVRTVVVSGRGSSFCAGSDIRVWIGATPSLVDASFAEMERAVTALESIPVPVVASIRGVAAGAGLQVALGCDLRIAADDARLGMPVARLGVLTPPPFSRRIIEVAGRAVARDLLLSGRMLAADEAWQRGIVNSVAPPDELDGVVDRLVDGLLELPSDAVQWAKAVTDGVSKLESATTATAVGVRFRQAVEAFVHRHDG